MKKIGQMLDLIYYTAIDSGHANFWNGTNQHKLEHTDSLLSLPLKMKIKRIDLIMESNAAFTERIFYYLRLGQTAEDDAKIYEDLTVADIVGELANSTYGLMYLLDGYNQFYTMGFYPEDVADIYQVHTFHTDVFIDMSKKALYLDFGLQSHSSTAYPAASGDMQLIVILGVEIL